MKTRCPIRTRRTGTGGNRPPGVARYGCAGLLPLLVLCGCASTGQLKHERDVLAAELSVARDTIQSLETEKQSLEAKVATLTEVGNVLEQEKEVRVQETADVRSGARKYVQRQLEDLREFSRTRELLDYVGSEVLDRAATEGENLLLVDMENPVFAPGTLLGGSVYIRAPGTLSFCVLRPQQDKLIVLWKSEDFHLKQGGRSDVNFEVPVGVEKGDLIGLFCPGTVQVPYDQNLGRTMIRPGEPAVGAILTADPERNRQRRSYSFGVTGFLEKL